MSFLSFFKLFAIFCGASGLVISERAQMSRGRLFEALSSPSGKLTLSPEIVIPDPSDPTAILLQASLITTMSEKMRTQAKANCAFLSGGVPALKTFCNEQETSRGNFPSPVPAVYCGKVEDMSELVNAGAEGILVSVCDGKAISAANDIAGESSWVDVCKSALEAGLQPIPELTLSEGEAETSDVESLLEKVSEMIGEEPVSVLLTVEQSVEDESGGDTDEGGENEDSPLPTVPKALSKRVPILGSIRAKAGEGRMGLETGRLKAAGFTGAVLRQECIPAVSMSQDMEYLTNFWSICIGDLKSTKSKTFNFQSRNYLEKSVPLEWAKYQKDVLDSGALGEAEDSVPMGLNPDAGDYKGF